MKKIFTLFIAALCTCFINAYADCSAITVTTASPYEEGFEDGWSGGGFECWTEEIIAGGARWDYSYGNASKGVYGGAYEGEKNLRFFESGRGSKARFISPVFDLSAMSNPTMSFYYCNGAWAGDQDTLIVLVRQSSSSQWQQIAKLYNSVSSWESFSVEIGNNSATAQIAFEGHLDAGYGIVIDMLRIAELSEMTVPVITSNSALYNTATVAWSQSSLATKTQLIINPTLVTDDVLDGMTPVETSNTTYTFDNLTEASRYYIYMRSVDGDDNTTDWIHTSVETNTHLLNVTLNHLDWYENLHWEERPLAEKYQVVVSYEALGNAALEDAEKTEYVSGVSNYNHNFEQLYNTAGHIYIRAKFSDIGFGDWQHYFFNKSCWIPNLAAKDATTSSVTISWDTYANETMWIYILSDYDNMTDDALNHMTSYYATQKEKTLTGLETGSTHTFYLAAIDPNHDGRNTGWSKITFSTLSGVSPIVVTDDTPFAEDFETAATEWTISTPDNRDVFINYGLRIKNPNSGYNLASSSPYEGNQNAAFIGYKTEAGVAQFISPVLNIAEVSHPRLSFYYQNLDWGGDVDELAVFYRTSATAEWQNLMENGERADSWTQKEFDLSEKSETFQLMFEARDNIGYGYGILLDNITLQNYIPTGIANAEDSPVKVWAEQGCINVENATGIVTVTNIIGQKVASKVGEKLQFQVNGGIYIVQAGEETFKVIVR